MRINHFADFFHMNIYYHRAILFLSDLHVNSCVLIKIKIALYSLKLKLTTELPLKEYVLEAWLWSCSASFLHFLTLLGAESGCKCVKGHGEVHGKEAFAHPQGEERIA